jgi:hypothetical protein
MRTIQLRFGQTAVLLRKTGSHQVTATLKTGKVAFLLKEGGAELEDKTSSLDEQLLTHIKWAITNYFTCKKVY